MSPWCRRNAETQTQLWLCSDAVMRPLSALDCIICGKPLKELPTHYDKSISRGNNT